MGGHHHDHVGVGHLSSHQLRQRLVMALGISLVVLVVSVMGAALSGSLALLADAGHILTDVTGLLVSLLALTLAARPATSHRTFGLQRLEILAAAANAALLFLIAAFIGYEAWHRWQDPTVVDSPLMLVFAVIGLIANLIGMRLLQLCAQQSLNLKGAYLEMFGDLLGSVAVIVAAIGIWLTGWQRLDPLVSIVVVVMIVPRAWLLLREALSILLETTPKSINLDEVREHLLAQADVIDVHDMHAWTITSGLEVLSAHVVVRADEPRCDTSAVLQELHECLLGHFNIAHSTLQIEPEGFEHAQAPLHR